MPERSERNGYKNDVTEGADYPLPVLSSLLPEGIVPVDENGKPWPKDPTKTNWSNADLDFTITVRKASTLTDGTANQVVTTANQPDNLPSKANYRAQISYIQSAGRYMVRLVPKDGKTESIEKINDPLTNPLSADEMQMVLDAPKLKWNQSVQMDIKVMAVEMPQSEVTADNRKQSDSYTEKDAPETNILLRRWQQNRSFASSWMDGFKFLTDDRSDEGSNADGALTGNPFEVGQEYSGYYMADKNCDWKYIEQEGHYDTSSQPYKRATGYFHIFKDTRLDSTGPDGRIKDRTLIGDMIRGIEDADKTVDIEDYSRENINDQTDLEKLGAPEGSGYKQGLRKPNLVSYAELDVNGNGRSGRFVTNTMKLYVKNPNIMLDKKISSYMEEDGLGDNDGYPDYRGRILPQGDPEDDPDYEIKHKADKAAYDDYAENPGLLFKPDNGDDPNGNGVDYNGLGYGSRLWYGVTVMNKPVDSPMHTGSDYAGPVKNVLGDAYTLPRQDADNEYLTKADGTYNKLSEGWGSTDQKNGLKLKIQEKADQKTYEEQLAVRRRKLSESGSVAHGAFVFSDYLPWTLDYDGGDGLDGICIQIQHAGGKKEYLTGAEALKAGWIIKDSTPPSDPAVNDGLRQFVSITVVPPATDPDTVIHSQEDAYKLFEGKNSRRPAGYLGSGDKFTLKIRTKVCDIPDVAEEKGNYDKDGYSRETFYNRAFVNLEHLDGDYSSLKSDGTEEALETSWYGDQKKDSISYYSGTESRDSDIKTTVRDNQALPASKFLKQENAGVDKPNNILIQNASGENYNQKADSTDDRYAFDTAAGFKVVSPSGFARVTTSRPVENRNGKYQDPAYKSTEDVRMYLGETSLLRGSVGSVYTISDLPLYGVNADSHNPDLTAENYKDYAGYKVITTVQSIKPGIWSAPEFSQYGNTSQDKDTYRKELEDHLKLSIYVSLRSESGDLRQKVEDGFDINDHYDHDPSKPVIWHQLMAPITLSALKAGNLQETGITVPDEYRNDINQIMWEIKSADNDPVLNKYPIPAGFRLDVDVDYTKDGKQDAHTLENKGVTSMTGHYPLHQVPFTASSSNAERCDDVQRSGGQINMNVNAVSADGSTLTTDTYMANYTDIYVKYGEDHGKSRYCRLPTRDTRYDASSLKTYEETYRRSGLILVLYSPIGELKLDGRYLKQVTSENGEMLDSDQFYYNWKNEMSLTGSSRLLAYTVTLDNIQNERLDQYGKPGSEQREDNWMQPAVVVKIPALMEIDSANLQYKDYYKDVQGNTGNPLNPDYRIKTAYPNAAPLYWTYRVVHRDYNGGLGATYTTEGAVSKDTTADLILAASYKPYKTANGETFLKFFFDGTLKPGDSIVIDFMVRVRTTDPSSPLAQGDSKVIKAYATDDVGNPKWVDWKRGADDAEDAGTHQIRDDYDYDEDKQSTETLLTVKNDTITFAAMDAFSIPKMVTSILTPDEGPSYNKTPVPVLEGETYTYKLQMSNLATYSGENPSGNMHRSPVFYDIWPFAGDTKILKNTDGSIGERDSRWNAWMLPQKDQFTLTASSGASLQQYDPDAMPIDKSTNTFEIPQKDYQIWVGPVDVQRDPADGSITRIKPLGTDSLFSADDRSYAKDAQDNFYQQLAISAFGDPSKVPDDANAQTSDYDIRTNHVTLDELADYRNKVNADEYDEIRKALRDMAVTFNQWPGADTGDENGNKADDGKTHLYKMYASTTFTLNYKAETPLNLPVFVEDRNAIDENVLKKMIEPYAAGNSFVASTDLQKPAESWTAQVYVHNPKDRGEIGDYVWLDDNVNGLEDEIEYAIPDTGDAAFTRKLPKRDADGKPDWGENPDPGINGVLVELLNEKGQPCNFDGQAVDEAKKTADGSYIVLDANGDPKMDAGGNVETSKYGPWTCTTRSDYYGNHGYYILPNLKVADAGGEPIRYKLRFVMPEEYNDYGLTTWEIGKGSKKDDTVSMDTIIPDETKYGYTAKTLTFITKDAISVRAASDKTDEENVSYDVGVGLPVAYGGAAWFDTAADPVHGYDGYYDNPEYAGEKDPSDPSDDHDQSTDQEKGFVYKADGTGQETGATITAVIAGHEKDGLGNIVPATDMRGNPMITTTYTMTTLKEAYKKLKAKYDADPDADSQFKRGKKEYKELSDRYPAKYPAPPADDTEPTEEQLEAMLEPFVGTYEFKYMKPDVDYEFFISLPDEAGTGKELYRLTKAIDDEPLKRRFENDAKADGWTYSFKAVRPALLADGSKDVQKDDEGHLLHYRTQKRIDFGVIYAEAGLISGVIWDDSSDDAATQTGTGALHDGIRRTGYKGVPDEDVELYAYAWTGSPDDGGAGWRALTTDPSTGSLKFAEDKAIFDPNAMAAAATPSNAEPIARTKTSSAGEWQFKLEPQVHVGEAPDRTDYLVGYRVRVPALEKGYTYTTIHSSLEQPADTTTDSDLCGDTWMHRRANAQMDGTITGMRGRTVNWNPEKNGFDYRDPYESSIYLPYKKVDKQQDASSPKELGNGQWYDYSRVESISGVDGGLIPYAKGSLSGIVWNDIQKENGKLKYDGIREDKEAVIPDVPVMLQYQLDGIGYTFVYEYDPAKFDISQITGDYWISGNYIFPRDIKALNSLKALAKTDEDRRKKEEETLKTLKGKEEDKTTEISGKEADQTADQTAKAAKESKLAQKQDELAQANRKRGAASVEQVGLNSLIDAERKERTARYSELNTLQKQLASETDEDKRQELQKQIDTLQKEIDTLTEQIRSDSEQLLKATDEYNKWNDAYTDIKNEIDETTSDIVSLTGAISRRKQELDALKRDLAQIQVDIKQAEEAAKSVYFTYAKVQTDKNGCYSFNDLPMFDETKQIRPDEDETAEGAFTDPKPYSYRVVMEKAEEATYTIYHASGAKDDENSDVQIMSEEDYNLGDCADILGVSRGNLGVSDAETLMEVDLDIVNGYDGHLHVRMDVDESTQVRSRRYAREDAGILLIDNRVRIGGYVWQDDNGDGRQNAGEKPVPDAVAVLYQYDPEATAEYYTYELVDKGVVSTASEAEKPGTASPSYVHELHGTGNAWLENRSQAGTDITSPGQMKIRITGIQTRKGAWKPYRDLNGNAMMTTGADGRYEFEVPAVNAKAAHGDDRLYRYRVMIHQPFEDETRIWSDYRTAHGIADSDVIPSNAFMDLDLDVLDQENKGILKNDHIPEGTELTINGIYDPSYDTNGLLAEIGDVYGMQTDGNYRMAMSAEFEIYDEREGSVLSMLISLFGNRKHNDDWIPDLRYIEDCLDMDAGLRLQDKLPDQPLQPEEPDKGHHSFGGGSGNVTGHAVKQEPVIQPFPEATQPEEKPDNGEEPPFFGIPKTGVVPIGITALTIAAIAGALMFITRSDKGKKKKKGRQDKDKRHEN